MDDRDRVAQLQLPQEPLPVESGGVRFLGRGVAINVVCAPLSELRETMRRRLTRVTQDSHTWRPHVTVQNNVEPSIARQLHEELSGSFQARNRNIVGILPWEYLGGFVVAVAAASD